MQLSPSEIQNPGHLNPSSLHFNDNRLFGNPGGLLLGEDKLQSVRPRVLSTTQVDDKTPSVLLGVQKNDKILQSSLIEAVSVAPPHSVDPIEGCWHWGVWG